MVSRRVLLPLCLGLALFAGACSKKSPTEPAKTRVITITGDLNIGDVPVGTTRSKTIRVSNSGNDALTVTALTINSSRSDWFTASWTNGTIAVGAGQDVTVFCRPLEVSIVSATINVQSNQTEGVTSVQVLCNGV